MFRPTVVRRYVIVDRGLKCNSLADLQLHVATERVGSGFHVAGLVCGASRLGGKPQHSP